MDYRVAADGLSIDIDSQEDGGSSERPTDTARHHQEGTEAFREAQAGAPVVRRASSANAKGDGWNERPLISPRTRSGPSWRGGFLQDLDRNARISRITRSR